MKKSFEEITAQDGRYELEALRFVYEGLGWTVRHLAGQSESGEAGSQPRHVSGQELCEGLRRLACQRWGRLAALVLRQWGIKTTRDLGEIVYLMIKHQWMNSQAGDRIEDFDNVYDFKTAFEEQFVLEIENQDA
jgi:uncharacterized repeat protein (TIGR04138 family)